MAKSPRIAAPIATKEGVPLVPLQDLQLDADNARFGSMVGKLKDQVDILDHIVNTFGVDDVLSSIAVNGYFKAEPLVCRQIPNSTKATVVEGNRRLAACLIIAGDPRARRQEGKASNFRRLWKKHGEPQIDPVPAILFGATADSAALLSYLGVRHIAASQPWDSYAKAAWVAKVVEVNHLDLKDVAEMIGDQHRTIHRMLQGYYVAQQLVESGAFKPEDSLRRGRGSVTDYPFSWLYTLLGYSTARSFVGIVDDNSDPKPKPIPRAKVANAGLAVRAMFGDRSKGRNAAIEDSRQLGDLASTLTDPVKVGYLEQGKSVEEIERLTKPVDVKLMQGLTEVRDVLRELIGSLSETNVSRSIANTALPIADANSTLIGNIVHKLKQIAN